MHGRFTWYELYTTDVAGAKRFYTSVAGWGLQRFDKSDPNNPYEMWTAGEVPLGGVMPLDAEMKARGVPPHWLPYIDVDNCEDIIRRATALGAKVAFGPMTMPDVGTFAGLKDPQGAIFAVIKGATPSPGYDGNAVLGKPSWHELTTSDYKAAWNFYSQLFGWEKINEVDIGGGAIYLEYGAKGKSFGGMFNSNPQWGNAPPNWLVYTHVRDVKTAAAAIARGGGKVINGPMEVPGGDWIVACTDPQGAAFAFHARGAAAPSKPAKTKAKAKPKKKSKPKKKGGKKAAKKAARKAKKKAKKKKGKKKKKR